MKTLAITILAVLGLALVARAADDKTYKPDDEGYIRNWLLLEPIALSDDAGTHEEGTQKAMFDKQYFDSQKDGTPKAGDKVKAGDKELAWKAFQSDEAVVDLAKFASDNGKQSEKALFLGIIYVTADDEIAGAKLSIGSDDSSVWCVNGKEVIRVYSGRAAEKDQDSSPALTLKKGVNIVRAAVINGDGATGMVARFLDKDGRPVKNLKISLTPPAK